MRILHLEDDCNDAGLVRDLLEANGIPCDTTRVQSREEFVASLGNGGFDVILADYSLPSFDGMSALRIATERSPEVPFIFVSGKLGEEVAIEALKLGASDYVLKERLSRIVGAVRRAQREARDRAERRHSEAILREQADLLDHTHDAVFVRGIDRAIRYWNRGAEEMYGWTAREVRGKAAHEFLKTILPAPLEQIEAQVLRTGRWQGELVHTRRNGTQVVVASRWALQRDERGVPLAVLVTNTDVTERKRAEEELRASEARFRSLTALSSDWYWEQDENLRFTYTSRRRGETTAYPLELILGKTRWELPGIAPISFLWPEHQAALTARQPFRDLEYARTGPGGMHYVSISGAPIFDDHGVFTGYRGIGRDITERKRAEAEKARLEAELRRAQKMEAIGTLAGGIAHDFNNILGAILGYGEVAQRKCGEASPACAALEQVMLAGYRGKCLVERILAFSRSGVAERVPVHVQSVVEETLELLAASLPAGVRLEKGLCAGDAAVIGDATQLHQMAMNLCTNAFQAMTQGGTLTVILERVELPAACTLSHGALAPGPYARLQVRDTGNGIPPAVLERMFDPFFTTKKVGQGTGLGLSLVHGIVADFGGAIDIATCEGAGTTFAVWLPASGETAAPVTAPLSQLPHGHGETVMVVDDERPLVALAEETLALLGYEPAGFESSLAALAAFRAEPGRYDLVLTDETMPELTGTELAREVRRVRADLPIVLMSGYSGPQLAERAHGAGVRVILRKPLVSRDIADSLARLLRAKGAG